VISRINGLRQGMYFKFVTASSRWKRWEIWLARDWTAYLPLQKPTSYYLCYLVAEWMHLVTCYIFSRLNPTTPESHKPTTELWKYWRIKLLPLHSVKHSFIYLSFIMLLTSFVFLRHTMFLSPTIVQTRCFSIINQLDRCVCLFRHNVAVLPGSSLICT